MTPVGLSEDLPLAQRYYLCRAVGRVIPCNSSGAVPVTP